MEWNPTPHTGYLQCIFSFQSFKGAWEFLSYELSISMLRQYMSMTAGFFVAIALSFWFSVTTGLLTLGSVTLNSLVSAFQYWSMRLNYAILQQNRIGYIPVFASISLSSKVTPLVARMAQNLAPPANCSLCLVGSLLYPNNAGRLVVHISNTDRYWIPQLRNEIHVWTSVRPVDHWLPATSHLLRCQPHPSDSDAGGITPSIKHGDELCPRNLFMLVFFVE